MSAISDSGRFRDFVMATGALLERLRDERAILEEAAPLLKDLVMQDDWLPGEYAAPNSRSYRQYLLHCDSRERFSIVSFVWGPGQATPIHDHRVWGLVGMLRGSERCERWRRFPDGRFAQDGTPRWLVPGDVDTVSPRTGDVHRVANALPDRPSVSIHLYGANIGRVERSIYDPDGTRREFVSGYSNSSLPNIW